MGKKRFYITTPIYYVNDAPHIGHAYTSIAADVIARCARKLGYDVRLLTGTDEHGQKISKTADSKGINVMEFCSENSAKFHKLANDLQISYDYFIRTTEGRREDGSITVKSLEEGVHLKTSQKIWSELYHNGWIYKSTYAGWYAVRDEAFYSETELVDGKAPTGAEVTWHEEEGYFFRLSEFSSLLTELYQIYPSLLAPFSKRQEVLAFMRQMHDLCVSRTSFDWGVPLPMDAVDDPKDAMQLKEDGSITAGKHVMYVWLDALVNYLSYLGYSEGQDYQNFWLNGKQNIDTAVEDISSQSELIKMHLVGKDIIRFHAIYWPAFLIASRFKRGEEVSLKNESMREAIISLIPSRIYGHGWWTNEGQKISKSLGNVINPYDLIEQYGLDQFRYFLLREIKFGEDGDYSKASFIERVNSDLANNVGNFLQRVCSMIEKYSEGEVSSDNKFSYLDCDLNSWTEGGKFIEFSGHILNCRFQDATNMILELSRIGNAIIEENKPWQLFKEGRSEEIKSLLSFLFKLTIIISNLIEPFMPSSSKDASKMLRVEGAEEWNGAQELLKKLTNNGDYKHKIGEVVAGGLFKRIEAK